MESARSAQEYNVKATLKGDMWVLDAGGFGTTEVSGISEAMPAILKMLRSETNDPVPDGTYIILHIEPSAPATWIRQHPNSDS